MGCSALSKFITGKVTLFLNLLLEILWSLISSFLSNFLWFRGYSKTLKKSSITVKLLNTQGGSLTVMLLTCAALYVRPESHLGPQLSDHKRLAPYYQPFVGQQYLNLLLSSVFGL